MYIISIFTYARVQVFLKNGGKSRGQPRLQQSIGAFGVREGGKKLFWVFRLASNTDKFADVVRNRMMSSNNRVAKCGQCGYCKGDKHVYTYTFPDGESKAACGAFVLEIPDVALADEIKRLIHERHEYFMKNALYVAK